jgi:glycosyltransferase involved in cell wall biosynthesis
MKKPVVSVIIRTCNRAKLLTRAIDSVLRQTFTNFELIILDDHSEDDTSDVVARYSLVDDRIVYIRHTKNFGPAKSFNTANKAAVGKFVAYLDDDDTWRSDKLQIQLKVYESCGDEVGLVTGGVQYWNTDNDVKMHQWLPYQEGYVYEKALGDSGEIFGPPSVVMIRKNVLDKIGEFRQDMPRGCCQQYFLRLSKKYEIRYTNSIVIDYNFHENAITTIQSELDIYNSIDALHIIIDTTKIDLEKYPNIYFKKLIHLAHLYAQVQNLEKSVIYYKLASNYSPVITKNFLYILIYSQQILGLNCYNLIYEVSEKSRKKMISIYRWLKH